LGVGKWGLGSGNWGVGKMGIGSYFEGWSTPESRPGNATPLVHNVMIFNNWTANRLLCVGKSYRGSLLQVSHMAVCQFALQ
jgi:hypothetical protein